MRTMTTGTRNRKEAFAWSELMQQHPYLSCKEWASRVHPPIYDNLFASSSTCFLSPPFGLGLLQRSRNAGSNSTDFHHSRRLVSSFESQLIRVQEKPMISLVESCTKRLHRKKRPSENDLSLQRGSAKELRARHDASLLQDTPVDFVDPVWAISWKMIDKQRRVDLYLLKNHVVTLQYSLQHCILLV